MDIEPFLAAAGLAGIEEGAVHKVLDGEGQVRIGAHIGGILAAKFEPDIYEAINGCVHNGMAARDRSRKDDVVGALIRDGALRHFMAHMRDLEKPVRCACLFEGHRETLGAEWRLA